jgi:hypothetical protein
MNKFEQLIEYVINDEEAKARELFHDIVVEKSRQIYEEMMEEETVEEAKHDDEDKEEMDESAEAVEEGMEEAMGGDQADDLIDDIEVEEEGIAIEGEGEEAGAEEMADADLEDRVVDLEDKLDELMAEFEALMGDEGAEEADMDVEMGGEEEFGGDMDAEEVAADELETEGMMENVSLKAAPKPVTTEPAGTDAKSPVAANSGAKGAVAKPVSTTGGEAQGRAAPTAKDAIGKVGNTPAQSTQEPKPATKPHLAQASGVNTKSPLPKQ